MNGSRSCSWFVCLLDYCSYLCYDPVWIEGSGDAAARFEP